MRSKKRIRQEQIRSLLEGEPFLTDEELARRFAVSVQTIRLDRMEMHIPEMRERARRLAAAAYAQVRSVAGGEVVGQLVDVQLGRSGISVLEPSEEMAFERTGIVRGHYIFAQANSLAVAIIDAPVALTGRARLQFWRPVRVGELIVCKAELIKSRQDKHLVDVKSRVSGELVFNGQFIVAALQREWELRGFEAKADPGLRGRRASGTAGRGRAGA